MLRFLLIFALCFAPTLSSADDLPLLGVGTAKVSSGGSVTFDASSTPQFSNTATFNYTGMTVGTANAIVAVVWCLNQSAVSSVVWDSGGTNLSLSLIKKVADNDGLSSSIEIWGATSAGNIASGNKTLAVTTPACNQLTVAAASFSGVNSTFATAFANTAANFVNSQASPFSITNTSASGHIVLGAAGIPGNPNHITMGGTQLGSIDGNGSTTFYNIAYSRFSGSASVSVSMSYPTSPGDASLVSTDVSP